MHFWEYDARFQNYKSFLKDNLFESSCISLITEPSFYERETVVTEKTLMALWGGTLPIWVGGWGIADWMQSTGFDVFDDIIDHSYQWMPDPYERCYHAIYNNLDILRDHDLAQGLVTFNQARLKHNLDLLQSDIFTDLVKKITQENGLETKLHTLI